MSKITSQTKTTTTKSTRVEIPLSELRRMLATHLRLPESVEIFVEVPGGGDWSNTDLQIDDRGQPLVITYQSVEKTDE